MVSKPLGLKFRMRAVEVIAAGVRLLGVLFGVGSMLFGVSRVKGLETSVSEVEWLVIAEGSRALRNCFCRGVVRFECSSGDDGGERVCEEVMRIVFDLRAAGVEVMVNRECALDAAREGPGSGEERLWFR